METPQGSRVNLCQCLSTFTVKQLCTCPPLQTESVVSRAATWYHWEERDCISLAPYPLLPPPSYLYPLVGPFFPQSQTVPVLSAPPLSLALSSSRKLLLRCLGSHHTGTYMPNLLLIPLSCSSWWKWPSTAQGRPRETEQKTLESCS